MPKFPQLVNGRVRAQTRVSYYVRTFSRPHWASLSRSPHSQLGVAQTSARVLYISPAHTCWRPNVALTRRITAGICGLLHSFQSPLAYVTSRRIKHSPWMLCSWIVKVEVLSWLLDLTSARFLGDPQISLIGLRAFIDTSFHRT